MKMKMKIGITMRVVNNDTYLDRRDALSTDWPEYLSSVLHNAFIIPLLNQPDRIKKIIEELKITGVILSNGNNWGEVLERDETEIHIVEYCIEKNIPIFGVCRGFQVLNVFFGGSLETNLVDIGKGNHVATEHRVEIVNRAFTELTKKAETEVNSFHDQGVIVEGLSKKLRVFAMTCDGVVEGFFHPNRPVMAIQWHPERSNPSASYDRHIITRFFGKGSFWS